ncbi:efflux RND transporter periplasmic adaptor subunit [Ginsengibacter hankyongi]|uniref:Efflux RND transporter periplasmic adaptor subunit n=1 Tax=Ginsengibacter hankyongi TaxID=2607284 RepID=A0A5J5IFT6_9BACT|nr:efflux RND transporter periplasmic adaptor subunit [Ginsengibacter hankyongi]KAA9038639.1 efflux RND transporter periplasmic adaptor subunit [Ginsengibacter hankyongi]
MKKISETGILLFFYLAILTIGCGQKNTSDNDEATVQPRTPVTVTSMSYDPLKEYIELNATSSFLQKSYIKSNLVGYVKKVNVKIGDYVNKGQTLFVLKTKEAEAIGNSVNKLNPDFKFSGVNSIPANTNGFIAELNHQEGDYVQDGEQLAVISDSKSFAFIMNVPYEDMPYVSVGKTVEILLPDKERLTGIVSSPMPTMDSVSQTQTFAVKANVSHTIPQNLVAVIRIVKVSKTTAATLPKNSVLSNETQSEFWVMKMINDTTAVKVPVKKGIESGDRVEIISPQFSPTDKILLSGNYGLEDTALVIVNK